MATLNAEQIDPEQNAQFFQAALHAEEDTAPVIHELEEGAGDFVLVDLRTRELYEEAHVRGAVNIPFDELEARVGEFPEDKLILVYCYGHECLLSARAALTLSKKGLRVKDVIGGWEYFELKDAPVESGAGPDEIVTVAAQIA